MTHAVVVRYTTRPDSADENERLVRAMFAELEEQKPRGLRYTTVRLDDGLSFVHVAVLDGDTNPLTALGAFHEFLSGIGSRCTDGPAASDGTVVGSYPL